MINMTPKRKVRTDIITLLFVLALATVSISFLFAFHFTGEASIKSEEGIVFCQPENAPPESQKCFFTAHWHMIFDVKICGETKIFPFETGELTKLHTHVETNKVHWHGLLPVDPFTKNITDFSDLKLGNIFSELKIPISNEGIYNFKNGDKCPDGTPGQLRVFVNGEQKENFLDYVLRDGDRIKAEFG